MIEGYLIPYSILNNAFSVIGCMYHFAIAHIHDDMCWAVEDVTGLQLILGDGFGNGTIPRRCESGNFVTVLIESVVDKAGTVEFVRSNSARLIRLAYLSI